jgi:hypothetical protein
MFTHHRGMTTTGLPELGVDVCRIKAQARLIKSVQAKGDFASYNREFFCKRRFAAPLTPGLSRFGGASQLCWCA